MRMHAQKLKNTVSVGPMCSSVQQYRGYQPYFWHVDLSEIIYRVLCNPLLADKLVFLPSASDHPRELYHGDMWRQSPFFTVDSVTIRSSSNNRRLTFTLGDDVRYRIPAYSADRRDYDEEEGIGQLAAIYLPTEHDKRYSHCTRDSTQLPPPQWLVDIRRYNYPERGQGDEQELYLTDNLKIGLDAEFLEERVDVFMSNETEEEMAGAMDRRSRSMLAGQAKCYQRIEAAMRTGDMSEESARRKYYWSRYFEFPPPVRRPRAAGEEQTNWGVVRDARQLPSVQWKTMRPKLPTGDALKDKYSGRDMRIFRIFLSLYYDAYGAFSRVYYSIGGIYLTLGNMSYEDRQKTENAFIWGLVPPKHDLTDCLDCLVPQIKQLQSGFKLTLHHPANDQLGIPAHNEDVWVIGGIGVITGDLPALNKLANVKGPAAAKHPCRMCDVSHEQLGKLDYNIEAHKRVRQKEKERRKEIRDPNKSIEAKKQVRNSMYAHHGN